MNEANLRSDQNVSINGLLGAVAIIKPEQKIARVFEGLAIVSRPFQCTVR